MRSFEDLGEEVQSAGKIGEPRTWFFATSTQGEPLRGSAFRGDDATTLAATFVEVWEACVSWVQDRGALAAWIEFPELAELGHDFVTWHHYPVGHSIASFFDRHDDLPMEPSLEVMRTVARFFFERSLGHVNLASADERFVIDILQAGLLEDSSVLFGPVATTELNTKWRLNAPSIMFQNDVLHAWIGR